MKRFFCFLVALVVCGGVLSGEEPAVVYLTWTHDPSTTMMVQWHTSNSSKTSRVFYRPAKSEKAPWKMSEGSIETVKKSTLVHTVELAQLTADGDYIFQIDGSSAEYRFKTMPKKLNRPIRFVVGGDVFMPDRPAPFYNMNRVISETDPDFVVVMGDLVYNAKSEPRNKLEKLQLFLKETQESIRGKDGRLIPLLIGVGNHDVPTLGSTKPGDIETFYQVFAFPKREQAYRAFDCGDYLSLLLLDSDHTAAIKGEQTEWLDKALSERQKTPYILPIYHVAAYPSYYPFDEAIPKKIRMFWSPLFEKYNIKVAFEHHNHCYKRTYPLKQGWKDPTGVTYMGDGSWGVSPRKPWSSTELWYLAKSASSNACYFVTLYEDRWIIEVKDPSGKVIDILLNP